MAECLRTMNESKMLNNYRAAVFVTGFLFCCQAVSALEKNPCDEQSIPIFQCEISNGKTVALCANYDQTGELARLQYRFGKINNLELVYPTHTTSVIESFRFNRYSRYGVEYVKVSFSNGPFKYGIFKNFDENDADNNNSGIEVTDERNPASEVQLLCRKVFENKLQTLSSLPCDKEDALGCNR